MRHASGLSRKEFLVELSARYRESGNSLNAFNPAFLVNAVADAAPALVKSFTGSESVSSF
jgi:hypothetical protein